jgi:hypothetical protein
MNCLAYLYSNVELNQFPFQSQVTWLAELGEQQNIRWRRPGFSLWSNNDVVTRDTNSPPQMAGLWMNWRGCSHVLNVRWTLSIAFYFGPTLVETALLLFPERNLCKMDDALWVHRDTRREMFNVVFFGALSAFDFGQGQSLCISPRPDWIWSLPCLP